MSEHSHAAHGHGPFAAKRRVSLARVGVGVRLALAAGLVVLIWAAILPLVA